MSFQAERDAIVTRFKSKWAKTTPWETDRSRLDKAVKTKPWVRLSILDVNADQISISGALRNFRYEAIIVVQIFIPCALVDENLLRYPTHNPEYLADKVKTIFNALCFDNIETRETRIVGRLWSNEYYQVNVNTPFSRDELL